MKSKKTQKHKINFEAIGTQWQLVTEEELSPSLITAVFDRIETFDQTYSRFRSDSPITHLSKSLPSWKFPEDAQILFEFYELLHEATDGKITPLIGTSLSDAGYDAKYSLQSKKEIPPVPAWREVLTIDGTTVHLSRPILLDFGAAGKGYLVDIIGELLEHASIDEYEIDASGDIRQRSNNMSVIGLEDPDDPSRIIATARLKNNSICGSAINRRKWGDDWHHILNPTDGRPTRDIKAAWVVADTTMIADGLATALFFTDPNKLDAVFSFSYLRVFVDNSVEYSKNFEGEIF